MKSNNYAVHYNWVFERKIEWRIESVKYALTDYFGDETVFEEKMEKNRKKWKHWLQKEKCEFKIFHEYLNTKK